MRLTATIPMLALCTVSCVLRTPTLTAHTPSFSSVSSSGPPHAPAGDSSVDDSQVIEAGCSFAGGDIKGEPGTVRQVSCPPGCKKDVNVFGTGTYTSDTPVCVAAMHVGAISDRGGHVTVVVESGRPAYRGSKRNGVSSHDWGAYRASYSFVGVTAAPPPPDVVKGPTLIEPGCTVTSNDIHGELGMVYRVSCPPDCNVNPHRVYGTEHYSGDTPICVAGIHAGLANERGGTFMMVLEEGRPAYRGSKRNGIESIDWGAYHSGFRLQR